MGNRYLMAYLSFKFIQFVYVPYSLDEAAFFAFRRSAIFIVFALTHVTN